MEGVSDWIAFNYKMGTLQKNAKSIPLVDLMALKNMRT